MPLIALAVLALVALGIWWLTRKRRPSGQELMELSRAEAKVKVSDPITRGDIDILERWESKLLEDAIELRRAQLQRGDHPEQR
ncbi:MAG: hypothetical protein F4X65_04165 [Chloroflexi bacterium]|nr:hypothetical protein [Chloroflexota bacterium]